MRIGIVSDVHCEHEALRRTAEQMVADGVDEIVVAGDLHFQYRFSNETIDVVREFGMRCVAGNHDATLTSPAGIRAASAPHVQADHLEFTRTLPDRLETHADGKKITVVHANPWALDYQYLYAGNPIFRRCDELDTDFVVLGHTHVPMVERHAATVVINPGSLMLSRDDDGFGVATYVLLDTGVGEVFLIRDGIGTDDPLAL
jgi:putative phosphoesterase